MDKQIRPMNIWQFLNTLILSILVGYQWYLGSEAFVIGIFLFFLIMIGYMVKNK